MADFSLIFDGYDLNTIPNVEFLRRFPNSEPSIQIISHELIRRDGSVLTNVRHGNKIIPFEGFINAPSRTAYEEAIDQLKLKTMNIQKQLVIVQAGSSRHYTATKENLIEEHISLGNARINIAFRCSDPYGRDSALTLSSITVTTTPTSLGHTFLGTGNARPLFTVKVNSLTGGTGKYVGIGSSVTGQQIQVVRNWVAGDLVGFNCDTKKVYVNGIISDYSGVFPDFQPSTNPAYYYDNLTTRNSTIDLSYAKQYL